MAFAPSCSPRRPGPFNYALQAGSSEKFIRLLTDSLPVPNIQQPVELNCHGATSIDSLPHPATLSSGEVLRLQSEVQSLSRDPDHILESQLRLDRVRIENVCGYVDGGVHGRIS
jgi:hypothetical protein